MMKYVVLGLILIAVTLGRTPASALPVLPASASATFGATSGSATTSLQINIYASSDTLQISLSIQQDARRCDNAGACHHQPLISGFTSQDVGANDARIDRVVGHAFVHATIALEDNVSHATIPVRIDAIWANAGPETCETQAMAPFYDTLTCMRTATVIADVSVGSSPLIRNQTVPDGRLDWQEKST